MIMGASHITLGCRNVDAALGSLRDYGYRPEFVDRTVRNNSSKNHILAAQCDLHAIALLRSDRGFPIELVSYREEMPNVLGRYIGIFETTQTGARAGNADLVAMLPHMSIHDDLEVGAINDLETPAFFAKDAEANVGLRGVVLPVSNMNRAKRFWCGALGFKLLRETAETATLQFVSPIAAWRIQMVLVSSPPLDMLSVLDAKGMACLSLLSSNISEDVPRLVADGANIATEVFAIWINGKNMRVVILMDPDGAFVELLQIVR